MDGVEQSELHENPQLVLNKARGRGGVRLNGKDVSCGKFGTPECAAKSQQVVAGWLAIATRYPRIGVAPAAGRSANPLRRHPAGGIFGDDPGGSNRVVIGPGAGP
jgi:hypothetical protein